MTNPLPRATVAEWLEALVKAANTEGEALEASMAAIQTAALLQDPLGDYVDFGDIVFTADGSWAAHDPDSVFLGGGHTSDERVLVHPQLEADAETLGALEALGVCPASPETVFRELASDLFATRGQPTKRDDWVRFWELARGLEDSDAAAIIQSHARWRNSLLVHTVSGLWRSLFNALLPGPIAPLDGSRGVGVAIALRFHELDLPLLHKLGAVDAPHAGHELSPAHLTRFTQRCRDLFTQRDLPRNPQRHMLNFRPSATTAGPLDVLELLSDEAKALYTSHLLDLPATYEPWIMGHDTQDIYPPVAFDSPAVEALRRHGRIRTNHGTHELSDGLGDQPKDPSVLRILLSHPHADLIRRVFDLAEVDAPVDPVGEDAPIPLLDVWPGLEPSLPMNQRDLELIRCDGFRSPVDGEEAPDCILSDRYAYVVRKGDEEQELRSVLQGLGLRLTDEQVSRVLLRLTHEDVQRAREAVKGCSTDEERLLAAVGEAELRRGLPRGLLAILEGAQGPLSGAQIAQAAISTFHTGALRISRMWAGQPQPLPTSEMHVIVATIQTLSAKVMNQPGSYEFLADFKLLVFDEAHRSVVPTFTSVMEELGLTRLEEGARAAPDRSDGDAV